MLLDSPLIDELVAERYGDSLTRKLVEVMCKLTRETACKTAQQDIVAVLETRFGELPPDVARAIARVSDEAKLRDMVRKAAACADLDAFRIAIGQHLWRRSPEKLKS